MNESQKRGADIVVTPIVGEDAKRGILEVDRREDSNGSVVLLVDTTTGSTIVEVSPADPEMIEFALVTRREDAKEVFDHPYGSLPGGVAVRGAMNNRAAE